MRNLIVMTFILMNSNAFSQSYKDSSCFQSYENKAKDHLAKIKEKQESTGFGKKVSKFFCSLNKTTQLLMQQPGSASQKLKDCEKPIDYRKQNNAQIILNLSYSNANSLKSTDDKNCYSQSPCHGSLFTLGGTEITGSMEIASKVLKESKEVNSNISWRDVQKIVQVGIASGKFCNKGKTLSLRKVLKHIKKQVKADFDSSDKSVDNSERLESLKDSSGTQDQKSIPTASSGKKE